MFTRLRIYMFTCSLVYLILHFFVAVTFRVDVPPLKSWWGEGGVERQLTGMQAIV